jgi:hypothetical protein
MFSPRLLLSFCLLFLPVLGLGQERQKTAAVPKTCSVTKSATEPFVPLHTERSDIQTEAVFLATRL